MPPRKPPIAPLLLLSLALAGTALACTIPVFRYALDRWPGETFVLEVSPGQAELPFLDAVARRYDLNLRVVPAEENEAPLLLSPFHPDRPLWTGDETTPLDEAAFDALVSSPVRRTIVNKIVTGDSAVWVIVTSGDAAADSEFATRLTERLEFFQSAANLPEIDPNDPSSQLGPGPDLALRFSTLTVSRDDPDEALLVKMLAGDKHELLESGAPFVSPVFGRGRVLGAWLPEDMDEAGIEEVCFYLTGACSCEVKEQNPGWDLLVEADWDRILMETEDAKYLAATTDAEDGPRLVADADADVDAGEDTEPEPEPAPPDAPPDAGEDPNEPQTVTMAPAAEGSPGAAQPAPNQTRLTLLIAAALVAVTGGVLLLRKPRSP